MLKNKLVILVFSLLTIGLVFLSTSSLFEAQKNLANQFLFLRKQLVWFTIGFFTFLFCSKISLKFLQKSSFVLYTLSLLTLVMLFIPGFSTTIFGANRWLNLGPFSFQPTELCKLTSIIFFSNLLSKSVNFKKFSLFILLPIVLILIQPNLSSAFILSAIIITMYYISQKDNIDIFKVILLCIFIFTISIIKSPYKLARLNQNYHSQQLTISLASGSYFGKGIGNSTQKYKFLPQISTDSILAIIGEELGFLGLLFIYFLFYLLVKTILDISKKTSNQFGKIFSLGIAVWIFYQSITNIFVVLGIIPLTGIPLPFVSYGGSSLLVLMSAIGIVNNINQNKIYEK